MPPRVKLDDVIEALDAAGEDHSHYVDKRTGEIVMITNEEMEAAEEDELISEYPDWQRESILKAREILKSEDFVALPDQFDIHEYKIMEDFCLECQDRNVGETFLSLIEGIPGEGFFVARELRRGWRMRLVRGRVGSGNQTS